jgi:AhpD family alkylhydroperoxidase
MSSPFPTIPADRIQLDEVALKPLLAMYRLEQSIELDTRLANLIKVRASQINGCAVCIDMHWKDARAAGESEERLYSLDAWRESALYGGRERAVLRLTEAITRITDGHVPDEVWDDASASLSESELANVVFQITAINAWNRMMITFRVEPGHYQPGMLEAAA